jgi:3-keto-disaccharide hydrolase
MHRWFATAALTLTLVAFASWTDAGDKSDNTPPKGFTALFNGKDLTNWQGLVTINKKVKMSKDEYEAAVKKANEKLDHWSVKDGILIYDGKKGGQNLQSVKDYGDFELYVDWKIPPKGDSGIYLRGQPQVQIWDSTILAGNLAIDKDTGSGGLWNNPRGTNGQKPLLNADRPIGEWNTFHITVKGTDVTVILNGRKVVDKAPLLNFWEKDKDKKPLPTPARGPIELQEHGNTLWFKNIYVKELQ